jgi:hypothetical protein
VLNGWSGYGVSERLDGARSSTHPDIADLKGCGPGLQRGRLLPDGHNTSYHILRKLR